MNTHVTNMTKKYSYSAQFTKKVDYEVERAKKSMEKFFKIREGQRANLVKMGMSKKTLKKII